MANEQNLKPIEHLSSEEAKKRGKNGGIASVKARREKKAIRDILNDYLDKDIQGNAQYEQIAKKLGIDDTKRIKDVFTIVCVMNTLKKANLDDLEKMQRLLGENIEDANSKVIDRLDKVLGDIDAIANE